MTECNGTYSVKSLQRKHANALGLPGRKLLPGGLALLVAVLVPTGCILWFMNAAMENERLAVRGRLVEAYQPRLVEARENLAAFWSSKQTALAKHASAGPPERFAKLVRSGAAEAVIILDKSGKSVYPAEAVTDPSETDEELPEAWRRRAMRTLQRKRPILT